VLRVKELLLIKTE